MRNAFLIDLEEVISRLFFGRNIVRLNNEIDKYKYDIIKSPYFYVENVISKNIYNDGNFKVYATLNNKMCWASKTPCSNYKKIKEEKFLGLNVVYRDK